MIGPDAARQRGAALLIALLVVALAALLATEVVERTQRDLARTAAVVSGERAWQYAEGMEALARDRIRRGREAGLPAGVLDGQWTDPFPVPGGTVQGRAVDLGGRFNINALAHRDPERRAQARRALGELFVHLDLPPEMAERLASLFRPGPDGVRARLAHLSELARLEGFDPPLLARLERYVVALPDPNARLNLNRAEPEVLAATVEGLSIQAARALLARAPFETVDRALAQAELANVGAAVFRDRLAVESAWFLVQSRVALDGELRDYFRLVGLGANRYDSRYVSQGIF